MHTIVSAEEKPMFPLEPRGVVTLESDSDQSMSQATDSEKESFEVGLWRIITNMPNIYLQCEICLIHAYLCNFRRPFADS